MSYLKSLPPMERISIEFDSRCLNDLGLKMPRITEKYWQGVKTLAKIQETSPYFFHVTEAQNKGRIYHQLKTQGYTYINKKWHIK